MLLPLCRWGKWGLEIWTNLYKVTWRDEWAGIWPHTQALKLFCLGVNHLTTALGSSVQACECTLVGRSRLRFPIPDSTMLQNQIKLTLILKAEENRIPAASFPSRGDGDPVNLYPFLPQREAGDPCGAKRSSPSGRTNSSGCSSRSPKANAVKERCWLCSLSHWDAHSLKRGF